MSDNRLYVGGLPYSVADDRLREIFSAHGAVESARVVTDRMTGSSRGFGFVEMSSAAEAQDAISELDGANVDGRRLTVSIARPRPPRDDRGRGGHRSGRQRW